MKHSIAKFLEQRLGFITFINNTILNYRVPKTLNFWYAFGLLALIFFINQMMTGVVLAMFYIPTVKMAFASIWAIMHDIPSGWFIRYLHTTGASFLFAILYMHMIRGFLYGSYRQPRELVWVLGCLLFVLLLLEAFMGYVLPWGQLSYWGLEIIVSMVKSIPGFGDYLSGWILGAQELATPILQRFYVLHILVLPFVLILIIILHIIAIRYVGSSQPVEESNSETILFFPQHLMKESVVLVLLIAAFFIVTLFFPDGGGFFIEKLNAIPADPWVTPAAIHPVWYLTPFFSILRSVPNLSLGLLLTVSALMLWFFLPILDRSTVRLLKHKTIRFQMMVYGFGLNYFILGAMAWFEPGTWVIWISRFGTLFYFVFFFGMPWYSLQNTE